MNDLRRREKKRLVDSTKELNSISLQELTPVSVTDLPINVRSSLSDSSRLNLIDFYSQELDISPPYYTDLTWKQQIDTSRASLTTPVPFSQNPVCATSHTEENKAAESETIEAIKIHLAESFVPTTAVTWSGEQTQEGITAAVETPLTGNFTTEGVTKRVETVVHPISPKSETTRKIMGSQPDVIDLDPLDKRWKPAAVAPTNQSPVRRLSNESKVSKRSPITKTPAIPAKPTLDKGQRQKKRNEKRPPSIASTTTVTNISPPDRPVERKPASVYERPNDALATARIEEKACKMLSSSEGRVIRRAESSRPSTIRSPSVHSDESEDIDLGSVRSETFDNKYTPHRYVARTDRHSSVDLNSRPGSSLQASHVVTASLAQRSRKVYEHAELLKITNARFDPELTFDVKKLCQHRFDYLTKFVMKDIQISINNPGIVNQVMPLEIFRFSKSMRNEFVEKNQIPLLGLLFRPKQHWTAKANEAFGTLCSKLNRKLLNEPEDLTSIGMVENLLMELWETTLNFNSNSIEHIRDGHVLLPLRPHIERIVNRKYRSPANNPTENVGWGLNRHIISSTVLVSKAIRQTIRSVLENEETESLGHNEIHAKVNEIFLDYIERHTSKSITTMIIVSHLSAIYSYVLFGVNDLAVNRINGSTLNELFEYLVAQITLYVLYLTINNSLFTYKDKHEALAVYANKIGPICIPMMVALDVYPAPTEKVVPKRYSCTLDLIKDFGLEISAEKRLRSANADRSEVTHRTFDSERR